MARARRDAAEDLRIELPGVAAGHRVQRVARHVIEQVGIRARLLGHQPVVIERGLEVGTELRIAEGLAARAFFFRGVGRRTGESRITAPARRSP
jgi:hypothetical protein